MQPDERLDALLAQRQVDGGTPSPDGAPAAAPSQPLAESDAELTALLAAADQFAVWGTASPSSSYADRLEARLLARLATQSEGVQLDGASTTAVPAASEVAPVLALASAGSAEPAAREPAAGADARVERSSPSAMVVDATPPRARRRLPRAHAPRLLWQSLAAAVLLLSAIGAFAAASAAARPGQLLYGMHRLEQGVWVSLANRPEERVRLHIQYAREALDAFDAAVAQHAGEPAVRDALATFAQETQAAETSLAELPDTDDRDTLSLQFAALRDLGQVHLHTALPTLDWPLRVDVTAALDRLGAGVLHIAQASIAGTSHDGRYLWIVTITGSGFAPDALVLVDGRPMGAIVSWTPTVVVAQIPGDQLSIGAHTIGIGNSDDTASIVTSVATRAAPDDHGGSGGSGGGATATPGGSSGSSSSGSSSGDDHGGTSGGSATPTPGNH
jgi:IPT/TIG domain-containing protein